MKIKYANDKSIWNLDRSQLEAFPLLVSPLLEETGIVANRDFLPKAWLGVSKVRLCYDEYQYHQERGEMIRRQ